MNQTSLYSLVFISIKLLQFSKSSESCTVAEKKPADELGAHTGRKSDASMRNYFLRPLLQQLCRARSTYQRNPGTSRRLTAFAITFEMHKESILDNARTTEIAPDLLVSNFIHEAILRSCTHSCMRHVRVKKVCQAQCFVVCVICVFRSFEIWSRPSQRQHASVQLRFQC